MKNTLLLAALIALAGVTTASAGEPLQSPRGKENQTRYVRAEARALGGRADRSRILASPRQTEQASLRKAKTVRDIMPSSMPGKSLGGRNNPN